MVSLPPLRVLALLCLSVAAACGSPTPNGGGSYGLTVKTRGEGSVQSTPVGLDCGPLCTAPFKAGAEVVLAAVPSGGGSLVAWGGACSGSGECRVVMDGDLEVTADFTVPLTVKVLSPGGAVVSSPAGVDCGEFCGAQFPPGSQVTLTATPASGFTFSGWGGACSGTALTCTVTLDAATEVTASFAPEAPSNAVLVVNVTGTGQGTVTSDPAAISCPTGCNGSFAPGTQVTLTAAPSAGSTFAGWSGGCSGRAVTCTLTMDASRSVTARFTAGGGNCNWVHQLSGALGSSGSGRDAVTGIARDPATGRLLLVASLCGDAALAGSTVPAPYAYGNATATVMDANGTQVLSSFARGSTTPVGVVLTGPGAWMPDGRVAMAIQVSGSMDFGGPTLVQPNAWRTYAAAYATDGTLSWVRAAGVTTSAYLFEPLHGLAVDPSSGAVVLGTRFEEADTFGTSTTYTPTPYNGASAGPGADALLVRYDAASGQPSWVRAAGGDAPDDLYAVAVGPAGKVAYAGAFRGAANFGGGAFPSTQPFSAVVGTYDATGAFQFARAIENAAGRAVAVAGNGDVVVAGELTGPADFGGVTKTPSGMDAFVARYSANGTLQWVTLLGGTGSDGAQALALDPLTGEAWVAGTFTGTATFLSSPETSRGQEDVFLARLGTDGSVSRAVTYGGTLADSPLALSVDGSGNVLMGGEFSGTADYGGTAPFTASGSSDGFALCLSP
ncbi:MAG: hypothetical protein RL653_4023 [Pseudomonadota bacterium]|jgi:hypothetical protein